MSDLELLTKSIPEVGKLFRSGQLSPVELTTLTLQRIEELDPQLNAFITVTHEKALEGAKRAERELRSGFDRGPLHGVPVALKDLVDTAGIRTTCGARILRDHLPEQDAPLARNLEAAGAVLVGKTNMSEFAYGIVHPDYSQTNNPWDRTRTSGGSSGGSAAAIAAGLCFAAVGTDTGGSIRIPASYCGVAGLKPTYGQVSLEGVFPLSWSLDHAGPLARSLEDARQLLEGMLGKKVPAVEVDLKGLRFGVIQRLEQGDEPEVTRVFDAACRALQSAGAEVQEIEIAGLELADATLLNVLSPEASLIHQRWIAERPEDYAPFTRTQIELGFTIPATVYLRAQQFRRHLTRQFLRALSTVDLLISPSVAWVAPHEDPVVAGQEGSAEGQRSAPHNLTGLPALSLNAGFGVHGLPVGVQVVGKPHAEAFVLEVGTALERLLPEARKIAPLARA